MGNMCCVLTRPKPAPSPFLSAGASDFTNEIKCTPITLCQPQGAQAGDVALPSEDLPSPVAPPSSPTAAPGPRPITNSALPAVPIEVERVTLQSPDALIEDLTLLGLLGSGGYSIVYRGVYQGADVAVKFTASSSLSKEGVREALVAPQLNHPHVIKTYVTRGAILTRDFLHRLYGGPPPAMPPQAATAGFAIPQDNSEGSNDGFGDPRRGLPTPSLLPGLASPAPGTQSNATDAAQGQQPTMHGHTDAHQHAHQQQQQQHQQEPEATGVPFELDLVKRQGSTFTSPGAGLRALHQATAATAHTAASAATTTSTTVTSAHAGAAPGGGGSPAASGAAPLSSQSWDGWRDVVLRVGATAANTCVIMSIQELAECGSLSRAICMGVFAARPGDPKATQLARRALLRTASEICRGMIHCHAANVVHGDLKPANVLLARSRADRRGFTAKVADFGLAHVLGAAHSRTETSTWGTVGYAAPEMLEGVMCKASDVYAFGMVLNEMLTGSPPYSDLSLAQVIMGVTMQGLRPAWPDAAWPELCALGRRCLERQPGARPTFRQLDDQLVALEVLVRSESKALRALNSGGSSGLSFAPSLPAPAATAATAVAASASASVPAVPQSFSPARLAAGGGPGGAVVGGIAPAAMCITATGGGGGGGLAAAAANGAGASHGAGDAAAPTPLPAHALSSTAAAVAALPAPASAATRQLRPPGRKKKATATAAGGAAARGAAAAGSGKGAGMGPDTSEVGGGVGADGGSELVFVAAHPSVLGLGPDEVGPVGQGKDPVGLRLSPQWPQRECSVEQEQQRGGRVHEQRQQKQQEQQQQQPERQADMQSELNAARQQRNPQEQQLLQQRQGQQPLAVPVEEAKGKDLS